MSQLVYLQSMPMEPVRYYAAEPYNRPPMQPMTILYPAASAVPDMRSISTPPQLQQGQQPFTPNGPSYYICQDRPMEMNNNGKVVYLVPSAKPSTNAAPMSMFIQPNTGCSSLPMEQSHGMPDMYTAAQMLAPQQPQMRTTYVPMSSTVAVNKLPQSTAEPGAEPPLLRSLEVCRHYLNGRCNRRKCRFLHPDLHHPVEPAVMTYMAAAEPGTPVPSHTSQSAVNIIPYANSQSSSMNSFTVAGAPVAWNGLRA
ncbi:hypothetical protein ABB37_00685 [Leptomonas pyrrhocoris]|uniref:C3H1-type domain-containing protein n=1 Tax=Leptomonas pyrrhocoris TaxID=157538 RepID=A0A0N0E0K3_LEPPY|nr:hypothetical protein ABB37_00685 [Leptomonas pyrrhocoris]KPA86545.1 hypothetical protein ABB37_00685 [Leptomonas pyrrhocoris]|eukprot:XP_015664984.1 hypothetical protein ABB37_00685 [Leptomonas pyrrhocoris]